MCMSETLPPFSSTLPLEDTVMYILLKAQRGLGLSFEQVMERAEVSEEILTGIFNGQLVGDAIPEAELRRVAFVLNLNASALTEIAYHRYQPVVHSPKELVMTTTPFGQGMTVNAFLVWDPVTKKSASFDTGSDCSGLLTAMSEHELQHQYVFITHTHLDHLADIERLQREVPLAKGFGPGIENPLGLNPLSHGDRFMLGSLQISVLGTSGHTPGGLSYFIEGLEKPLVIVGDALFAGSMGGATMAYQTALSNNQKYIYTLPEDTIICPGHGPLTTVGQEKAHNAFYACGHLG